MTLIRRGVFFKRFLVSATTFLSPYTSLGMEYQTQTLSFILVTIQKSGGRKHRTYQPYPVYVFTIIGGHHFISKEAILGYKGSHTQQKQLTFNWLGHWCPPPPPPSTPPPPPPPPPLPPPLPPLTPTPTPTPPPPPPPT